MLYFGSFHTTTGHGFEAFFTEEDILVVAVCVKKEFHTIAVADTPISDDEWVRNNFIVLQKNTFTFASLLSEREKWLSLLLSLLFCST